MKLIQVKQLIIVLFWFFLSNLSFAESVPVNMAQRVGQSFMNTKLEKNSPLALIDISENANLPNIYIFGNENSFVFVAAEDCVTPILGYSTEGGFDTNQIPECVIDWLRSYDVAIESAKERRLEPTSEIRSEWESLLNGQRLEPKSRSIVGPLVRTKWGQSTPYNNLCPIDSSAHVPAGCGAIAMAQIMNYWEHPVRGVGSFSYTPLLHPEYGPQYADFGNTDYDWDNMKNVYSCGYTDIEAEAVATLVYHCGVSVEMDYDPNGSNVRRTIMDDALRDYFDFNPMLEYYHKTDTSFTNQQWIARLKGDLDNGQPVLYRGSNPQNHNIAHIFICDGYDENSLFHFNWGMEGAYDGYFVIGALHPGPDNYSDDNYAIFDCIPNQTSINPPANVNAVVDGKDVCISWNSVNYAVYYKLYRDEDLIANHLTSLSYVDEDVPYGMHSYYVKSVKSDGTMSLKSNTVSANIHFQGPVPDNLLAAVNNHDVNLIWQSPAAETAILQYGTGNYLYDYGLATAIYWGQRYPKEMLSQYAGMAVDRVSVYFKTPATYTLFLYTGDETNPRDEIFRQDYTATSNGWNDVLLSNPIYIDYTKDLWVVMYASVEINRPATCCAYYGDNVSDAAYWSSAGNIWKHYKRSGDGNYSWLMKTYITDGTYSYNLYRNGNTIANNLSGNSYTDGNLSDGLYNYYVTTNYFGGESDPSNTVQVQVGDPMYTITTNASPVSGGTVTGGGNYPAGSSVVLTALANPGYTFNRWDDGSTQNPRVVTVNSNLNFTAYFTQNQYIITVVASPSNAGTVSGGGAYYYGDYATLTATAYCGYEFQGWSDGSNENPHQVTVTGNASYTATFSQAGTTYYTVSAYVSPNGAGTVSGTGTFPAGNSTTLTATANAGYTFSHWNDGITTNPRTVTVNNNMSFTAYFTTQQYTITVNANPPLGGTVTGGGTYPYGATTTLTAMPNSGYRFMQWSDGNTANPRTITVTGNASYTALFISAGGESFMLTVTSGNLLLGQVAGGGVYPAGAMVEIRAIPASYSRFVKWNDGNTDNPRTVVVNHNLEFVAEFVAIPQYTITVNSSNNEWGYVMGGGTFTDGTEIQISAFANTGYMFVGWNDGNNQNPRTIMVTGNATYTARFVENTMTTYTLNLSCNANEGTVSGGGVYTAGTVVTIQAFPNPGYVFTKWSDEVVDNPRILMVNSDMTLEAFFATGIDDNAMGNVKVYPNPAKESICLIGIETNSEIQIYNMLGELVRTVNAGPDEWIGISGLSKGIYFIRVGGVTMRLCVIE